MSNKSNKRERLLAATDILFLQRGLDSVTLSDIAHLADVPLGNVYYYFKSKDLLLTAVIKIRLAHLKIDLLKIEESNKTAKNQLRSFVELFLGNKKENVPEELKDIPLKDFKDEPPSMGRFITLTLVELERNQNRHLYPDFSPIIELVTEWCHNKFVELDPKCDAKNNTSIFITSLIGACIFLLNTNVEFKSDAFLKGYIAFILRKFGLEDPDLDSNVATFPDAKSAWKK